MKHKLFTLLLAIMASVSSLFAQSGTCGDNLTWNLTNGVLIISGTGAMTDYKTSSPAPWYSYSSTIQHVVIGNRVTSIGGSAFRGCTGLTSVTIPNSVTSIGNYAFYSCPSLTSVTIPPSITSIGDMAFYYCSGLTSVTIPNSVTSIGNYAFYSCPSLTSVTIPNSVTSIGEGAFFGCSGLTSVTIPNSVTSIGNSAFVNCTGLTSVTIPNSVTRIGASVFNGCSGLTSITIPNSVTSIGEWAFLGCRSLTSVTNYATTPQTITTNVFASENISACTLYVPAGSLAAYKKATIWKNFGTIQAIGGTPCTPISGTCGGNLTWDLSCDSVLSISGTGTMPDFNSTSDNPWYEHRDAIKSVIIGNGVTSIGKAAFYECSSLKSIEFPNSVTNIGAWAFESCAALVSVTIPNSVTSIEDYAFENCSSLDSVTIPNSVTSIGYGAFGNCSGITSLTIGNSLTGIGNFAFYNCSSLTSVTNYATTPQTITTNVFGSVNISACTLYVPAGSLAAYRTATIWKDFGTIQAIGGDTPCTPISGTCGGNLTWTLSCDSILTIRGTGAMANISSASDIPWYEYRDAIKSIVIGNGVTSIAGNAFQRCTNLTSVTIPNSVTSIGQVAFYECSALTSVTIPNRVTSIGMGAFTYCSSLTSITIPNSVTSIGQAAFGYCTGLRSVTIGSGITSIEQGLFGNCSSLTSVTIPNNVTSIGQVAFIGCTSLTSVTIPNSVTSIGIGAFSGCSSLTSVTLPNGITSIEQETFGSCSSLTSVVIPDGVTSIGDWAFQNCTALTSVTIPSSVTNISDEVFSGCTGLRTVTNYATTPQAIDAYVFDYVNISACTLYVPAGSLAAYKKATIWKDFGTILAIGGDTPCLIASGTCGENLTWELTCDSVLIISGTGAMTDYTSSSPAPWYEHRNDVKSVLIDNNVTSIGNYAFRNCTSLISVTIPYSVTDIGNYAFQQCTSLTSVTIPNNVTSIGSGAFSNCTGLTSVTIPNSVTSIGSSAFNGCSGLISVTIGNSVTSIGNKAFLGCSALTSVTNYAATPQIVVDYEVFQDVDVSSCTLYVPADSYAAYLVANVWGGFGTILAIEGDIPCPIASGSCGGNLTWELSCDKVLTIRGTGAMVDFDDTSKSPWYAYRRVITSVVINNGVTNIGNYAFAYCDLKYVTIPNSVTSIGNYAFAYCDLKYVTIPNSVTSIGNYAFAYCGLNSVTIPNNVTSIGNRAFAGCYDLKYVTIPNSVTSIGNYAFYECFDLSSVANYATTPQTINSNVFSHSSISSCTLFVLAESFSAYQAADVWKEFAKIQIVGGNTPCLIAAGGCGENLIWELSCDSVLIINGTGAMDNYTNQFTVPWSDESSSIQYVVISNGVTSIGDCAFQFCPSLTSVTIPNSVTSIGDRAFSGCSSLISPLYNAHVFALMPTSYTGVYTIPDGIESIAGHAFYQCTGLTSVTIPNSVTSIGDDAFSYCSGLTSVTIPNSVTSIGDWAFSGCTGLTSIEIPNSVSSIGDGAFKGCTGLTDVTINANEIVGKTSLTHTLKDIFGAQVSKYIIGNSVTSIGDYAFRGCSGLTLVTIPNSVTSIGDYAFENCTGLTSVTIPNSVTSIESDAFRGCSGLTSVTIGNSLTGIGNFAFSNCTSLTSVTNYATTPQTITTTVFSSVNISSCTLYVPAESLAAYRTADVWKDFGQILPINAEDTDVTTTTVTASATTADIVWPKVTGAVTYTLEIKKNGELICTLTFDEEGHLISMSFAAPSRHNAPHQTQAAGFSFTITGLESGTTYNYTMIVKGSDGNVLKTESGTFTTIGTQGIEDLQCNPVQGIKILRNGQIFIQRGEKIYTITGQEIQSY